MNPQYIKIGKILLIVVLFAGAGAYGAHQFVFKDDPVEAARRAAASAHYEQKPKSPPASESPSRGAPPMAAAPAGEARPFAPSVLDDLSRQDRAQAGRPAGAAGQALPGPGDSRAQAETQSPGQGEVSKLPAAREQSPSGPDTARQRVVADAIPPEAGPSAQPSRDPWQSAGAGSPVAERSMLQPSAQPAAPAASAAVPAPVSTHSPGPPAPVPPSPGHQAGTGHQAGAAQQQVTMEMQTAAVAGRALPPVEVPGPARPVQAQPLPHIATLPSKVQQPLAAAAPAATPALQGSFNASVQGICFTPGEMDCVAELLQVIDAAARRILVQMDDLSNEKIVAGLINANRRNVDVRVILDRGLLKQEHVRSAARRLLAAGVPVVVDDGARRQASRNAVIDSDLVVTGSYRFGRDRQGAESFVLIKSPVVAQNFEAFWVERWTQSARLSAKKVR